MAAMQLTRTHRILIGCVVAGAVVIAGIGFAGSYAAVRELALKKGFGNFSLVFPIGIDAGICVLLALDLLLTWIRIPFPLLRQTAWLLTAATIAFNGAAAWPDPLGVGMHAVIPVLFVVTVEAARHAVGRIADITADRHMEGVRMTRWLLSPVPTFKLWRRMKLWELRSYQQAVTMEQDRLIYQARLQARYGRAWRRKAPVEALMPLRLARIGVPLSQTGASGLAAAGIEPALLPPAPAPQGAAAQGGAAVAAAEAVPELPAGARPAEQGAAGPVPATADGAAPVRGQAQGQGQAEAQVPDQARVAHQAQGPVQVGQVSGVPVQRSGSQGVPGAGPRQEVPQGAQAPRVPAQPGGYGPQDAQATEEARAAQAAQGTAPGQNPYGPQGGPGWFGPQGAAGPEHQVAPVASLEPTDMPGPHPSSWFAAHADPQTVKAAGAAQDPAPQPQAEPQQAQQPQQAQETQQAPAAPQQAREPRPRQQALVVAAEPQQSQGPAAHTAEAMEAADGRTAAEQTSFPDEETIYEAAYSVFRTFIDENNSIPSPEQLDIYLADLHGIHHPRSGTLLRAMLPQLKQRHQAELEAEHIA
ncbi:DUF2637 domain-containing protein [Streptomyces sp. NPDC097619]|uniref:DUF2637 domain-containing protein n=1 Tax=Streptomyces sp. NPDC097619 TaxID=3157228 RepID=UPI0033215511